MPFSLKNLVKVKRIIIMGVGVGRCEDQAFSHPLTAMEADSSTLDSHLLMAIKRHIIVP